MRNVLWIVWFAAACAPGEGVVEVSAWGEDEAVEGLQTDDGWAVTLDHWVVAVGPIELGDEKSGDVVAQDKGVTVLDLAVRSGPEAIADIPAPAGRQTFGFTIAPPAADAVVVDDVAGIAETMAAEGWAHWIRGSATDGVRTVEFEWGLDLGARYTNCEDGSDGTSGIAVSADSAADATITIHPDHLLWTALGTEEADLGFQAIADADGGDGLVDNADLAAVSTLDVGYETSGLAEDLYGFVAFSVAQSAHLNGDGLCEVRGL